MYIPLYIPKSLIVGVLVFVGCAIGWMLHGSAKADIPPELLQSNAAIAGPPMGPVNGIASGSPPTAMPPPGFGVSAVPPGSDYTVATPAPTETAPVPESAYVAATPTAAAPDNPPAPTSNKTTPVGADTTATTADTTGTKAAAVVLAASVAPNAAARQAESARPASHTEATPAPASTAAVPESSYVAATPTARAPKNPPAPTSTKLTPVPADTAADREPASPVTQPTHTAATAPASHPFPIVIPPFFGEKILTPLPGAQSRGVSFAEWESYRTDVAGRDILVTTDDSNYFKDRFGKLNGNTGDTDASGLNVTDATDSVIHGTESADEAPWQTRWAALVDLASPGSGGGIDSDPDDAAPTPSSDGNDEDNDDENPSAGTQPTAPTNSPLDPPAATAAVLTPESSSSEEWDFPYLEWTKQASSGAGTAVHTDEGTTLASGADALVIGADGYDDDDNRAAGEGITITRDDGNVVVGGVGDVNAQIGDSEQGAVIMDVTRTLIEGGGAY